MTTEPAIAYAFDDNDAVAVSRNPALDRIESYFTRENPHRFDGFGLSNDHDADYYDPTINSKQNVTRACVEVEAVAFAEISADMDMIYVPCGISSGLRAHEELDSGNAVKRREGQLGELAVSTYKAEEEIGGDKHRKAMLLNKGDTMHRGRMVGRLHPDDMIIAPPVREGSVREINRTGAFSRWQKYEEEDFMAFWYPVIDRCKGMMLDGDWNFSRNSIWEMMRGVLIQAGEIPSRPKADMDVFDLEGKPVSLLARAEKIAQTLKYQLGKGFEAREAATALAQIFTIDENIRKGLIPDERLHPVLKNRPAGERRAMDALEAELTPLIKDYCAHYMRLNDLPAEYHEAAKRKPKLARGEIYEPFKAFADDVSARHLSILSVDPSQGLRQKIAQTPVPAHQRIFDSHERFFEKDSRALMFEDDLYDQLSEWEKLALPFALGATETGLYPASQPMATMVFTDLKRGRLGFERAQSSGVQNMNEFTGAQGRGIADVIAANAREAETLKASLKANSKAEHKSKVVVNTPSFLRIADAINRLRPAGFVAAKGAVKTSPTMRLAMQMKFLDRNVDRAVFQDGWQYSNDLVQLRVRARMIQAGLVERPAGMQAPLSIINAADPKLQETLLDDITLLSAEVKRCADAETEAPEQALALMRLITLHQLLVDPTLQEAGGKPTRELVNRYNADESLTYNREEAKAVVEQAKALLIGENAIAAGWIPNERLYAKPDASDNANRASAKQAQNTRMLPYITAGKEQRASQKWAQKAPRTDEIHIGGGKAA